jgi:apolipoprotein D and lipocalin family protein
MGLTEEHVMKNAFKVLVKPVTLLLAILATACLGPRHDIPAVTGFDAQRYLGLWYEIARLPHGFEKDLIAVTADYRQNTDGTIAVVNRGYHPAKQKWSEAIGIARLPDGPSVGRLKVSFFRPFYADYRVIAMDADYRWAMVTTNRLTYLWILSRSPEMDPALTGRLIAQARDFGFDTAALIMVDQSANLTAAPANPTEGTRQ